MLKLILAYTPVMDWITYPYGLYLELFGVPEGVEAPRCWC